MREPDWSSREGDESQRVELPGTRIDFVESSLLRGVRSKRPEVFRRLFMMAKYDWFVRLWLLVFV